MCLPLKEVSLERLDLFYTDLPSNKRRAQTWQTGSPTKFSEKWMLPVRPKSSVGGSRLADTRDSRMLRPALTSMSDFFLCFCHLGSLAVALGCL